MKVEIKTNEKGYADIFKINDVDFGAGVRKYTIEHTAGTKPRLILDCGINELIINGNNVEIIKSETKEN